MTSLLNLWRQRNIVQGFLRQCEEDSYKHFDIEIMDTDQGWKNRAEEVFKQEVGVQEYKRRLEVQNKVFQKACQEGTIIKNVAISLKEDRFRPTLGMKALRLRPKMRYPHGIGAAGFAVVERNDLLPENNFFVPGKVFEVRLIHSNYPATKDDTQTGHRLLCLKFADHHSGSPLDLICHTGYLSPFYNADSIHAYIKALEGGQDAMKEYLLSMPVYLRAHIDGVRRLPESYYYQSYHAQIVYDFYDKNGVKRLARFRVIPSDGSTESGRLTEEEQKTPWIMHAPEGEVKPTDYLKSEFSDRLDAGAVDYLLQVQLHEPQGKQCHMMYNASLPWEETLHPWMTVARISLTRQLPDDVSEVTRFHLANLPDNVKVPVPQSSDDFNVVPEVLRDACDFLDNSYPTEPAKIRGDVTEYILHVVTGEKEDSGTDAEISISLIGREGCISYRILSPRVENDFEKRKKNQFVIVDKSVGEFLCAKININPKGTKSSWYLAYIILNTPYNGKCYTLPCYSWLSRENPVKTLRDGKATLATRETSPYLRLHRRMELQERQAVYEWCIDEEDPLVGDLPGHVAASRDITKLHKDAMFEGIKELDEEWKDFLGRLDEIMQKIKQGLSNAIAFIRRLKPLQQYEELVEDLAMHNDPLKHIIDDWQNDEEFARQIMNGPNPMKINQLKELPENFPVTEEMVEDYLEPGKTLHGEMQDGKVYVVSYPELQEYATWSEDRQRLLCAPMCLLYVRYGTMVPLAIQLTQTPNQNTPIFTKKDNRGEYSDWMMAKMWVRVADANVHLLSVHLLGTYLLLEPVAVSMMRNLPSAHPVFKLLYPYLRYLPAINTIYRKVLLSPEGALTQTLALGELPGEHINFMSAQYRTFKFDMLYLPENLVERGLMDEDKLPGYYYRDDGLKLWEAVQTMVSDMMSLFYRDDEDVELDEEINNFLLDLKHNGYHQESGLADKFHSRDELVRFLTIVVFRVSAQRSAVSKGMMETYAFAPNAPPYLLTHPPNEKSSEGLNDASFRKTVPPLEICQHFAEMCRLYNKVDESAARLGDDPEKFFTEESAQDIIRRFRESLQDLNEAIENRNTQQSANYIAMVPKHIRASFGR